MITSSTIRRIFACILILSLLLPLRVANTQEYTYIPQLTTNPYKGVDWSSFGQYKANLHAHTTRSDGKVAPADVIDAYASLNYGILSLTDHDSAGPRQTTWPWQDYEREPADLNMLAVQGNELSYKHHTGSFFNDYYGSRSSSVGTNLKEIGRRGGLAIFFHPGRYNKPANWSWYEPYFKKHKHLLGLEVYNKGDRYPNDRQLWDNLLTELMPQRPVWGFSNDDSHSIAHIGRNWNTLLLPNLSESAVKKALMAGNFYLTYQPQDLPAPTISKISVDEVSISIEAQDYSEILWISEGQVIHRGHSFNYIDTPGMGSYVRVQVDGPGGVTLTNPFGFTFKGKVTGVKLTISSLTLTQGDEPYKLKVRLSPGDALNKEVKWQSSNPSVAKVSATGMVSAMQPGKATISTTTAEGGYTASCKVTIKQRIIPPTDIKLNTQELSLFIGDSAVLSAAVYPENATDKKINWQSSDPQVIQVNGQGELTALSAGQAIITARTQSAALTASCTVTVTEIFPESLSLSAADLEMNPGEESLLTAMLSPENVSRPLLLWSSDNPTVVEVNEGKISAHSPGSAAIKVRWAAGELTQTCRVTVHPLVENVDKPLVYHVEEGLNTFKIPTRYLLGNNLFIFENGNISVRIPASILVNQLEDAFLQEITLVLEPVTEKADGQQQKILEAWDISLGVNGHNLPTFLSKAELVFHLEKKPNLLQSLTIYWYDHQMGEWVPQATSVDPQRAKVSIRVDHLSSYALVAEPRIRVIYLLPLAGVALALAAILWRKRNSGKGSTIRSSCQRGKN